jgi:hypothetical protein
MTPIGIDIELERYASQKWIEYNYRDELDLFQIKRRFEDDDQFEEVVVRIVKAMAKREEDADHSYDVMFTLLRNVAEMDRIVATGEPEVLIPIPRAGIKAVEMKWFLLKYKRVEWTPRAVARVLHAIPSPKFEASEWGKTPFWGAQGM